MTFSDPDTAPDGTTPAYPSSVTFSAGVGTASVTLYDAESTTITASQGVAVTGSSNNFTVKAGTQASLYPVVSTQPSPTLSCTGPSGSSTTCSSTNQANYSGNTLTAKLQLVDTYGNAVTATSSTSVALTGTGSGSLTPSSLTIANGSSTSSSSFTLSRTNGNNRTVVMTAKIGSTTELTITMSS